MKWRLEKIKNIVGEPITGEWGEDGGDVKVLRTTNFTNDGNLDLSEVVERDIDIKKVQKKRLQFGDTIIEKSGGSPSQPVGRVVYFNVESDEPYLCNNFTSVLRPASCIDSKYFFWFLFYNHLTKNTLRFQNKTTGIINLQLPRYLSELQIPLPPLPLQQKIATILDEADALRHKDKTLLAKYDELLQTVFYDMFGDLFITGKKNKTEYLSAVGDLVSGVAKNTNTIKDDFVEVPYMRVANVQDGHINLNEIKSILVSQQDFNKYLLRENDLLLTEGGDPDKLGRGAVWKGQVSPCIHQNHIFRIRITLPNLHPTYLIYLLSSRYGKAYFLKMAKQTTGIASINMTQLKNFQVIIPDFSLQKKFADVVENLEQQKSKIIQQQTYSENLFQSLMQQAFKGELVS